MEKTRMKRTLLMLGMLALLMGASMGEVVAETQWLTTEYGALDSIEYVQLSASPATNGSAYLKNITNRLFDILGVLGGVIVAILWVKVAINYFADDPQRKAAAKEDAIRALIGTIIIAVAVFGAIWTIAGWIVGANQSIIVPAAL